MPSGYNPDRPQDHMKEGDGTLESMAKDGTTMPDDPLTHRVLPSVPNPSQKGPYQTSGQDLAAAADNATDIPRSTKDRVAASGEVVTAYGDSLPPQVETKRLDMQSGNQPAAKGHGRDQAHGQQNFSAEENLVGDGPGVEAAPGEEQEDQEKLRSRRDGA